MVNPILVLADFLIAKPEICAAFLGFFGIYVPVLYSLEQFNRQKRTDIQFEIWKNLKKTLVFFGKEISNTETIIFNIKPGGWPIEHSKVILDHYMNLSIEWERLDTNFILTKKVVKKSYLYFSKDLQEQYDLVLII